MNDKELYEFDMEKDQEALNKEFQSNFFAMDENITYKLKLNSTSVKKIESIYEERVGYKYLIDVTINVKDKEVYKGEWKAPKTIIEPIFKTYTKDGVWAITKSGIGRDTKYSVILLD